LRAGELIRHALVEILREEVMNDPVLENISITVTEVRMSPDLKHAICFVEPLGAGVTAMNTAEIVMGLNRTARFLRGRLGRAIEMKFTPDLKFIRDESFEAARHVDTLFDNPRVRQDLADDAESGEDDA
jgi:ribosome-binding factor A